MVKGIARRVIVVDSPDPKLFDEAIFLVREDAFHAAQEDRVLQEARRAAGAYLQQQRDTGHSRTALSPALCFVLGGLLGCVPWLLFLLS